MGILVIKPAHPLEDKKTRSDCYGKERHDLKQDNSDIVRAVISRKSNDNRQDNDSNHIIDNCGTDYGCSDLVIELSQLFESCNSDAH